MLLQAPASIRYILTLCVYIYMSSCANEVQISGHSSERTLVWCLLNAAETDHYLRIQKSFLQEGINAYTLATDPASVYYEEGQLEVYVEAWKNDSCTARYNVTRINGDSLGFEKDEGIFASSPNILYHFSAVLDSSAIYKLFIKNKVTGDTVTAETQLVHAFTPLYPGYFSTYENFADTGQVTYACKYAVNGKIYELTLAFVYAEKNLLTGDSTIHTVPWQIFNSQVSENLTGYGNIYYTIPRSAFYNFIKNSIAENAQVRRTFLHLNYTFYAGATDLYLFYLNGFALSGLAELYATDNYTNITNGAGLFSSRYTVHLDSLFLTSDALDTLACGNTTGNLHFISSIYNPFYPGCY
jgi:hypothetical protein